MVFAKDMSGVIAYFRARSAKSYILKIAKHACFLADDDCVQDHTTKLL